MSNEIDVYQRGAGEYDLLIAREDYQQNIPSTLETLFHPEGSDILDLGAGTGRLSSLFAHRARSLLAFDLSRHMLQICHQKFQRSGQLTSLAVAADHRYLPVSSSRADVLLSGWSISYLASWEPAVAGRNLDQWLLEADRVLRPSGSIILLESLGTGNSLPVKLEHLSGFYEWLDEKRFQQTWIRTDYKFASHDEAVRLTNFFFGQVLADRVRKENLVILPECTGIWWMKKEAQS